MYPWFARQFTIGQGLRKSVGSAGENVPFTRGLEESDELEDDIFARN
jgi:hypothetical protein